MYAKVRADPQPYLPVWHSADSSELTNAESLETLDDFRWEARIMMQLNHPNIIKMYGNSTGSTLYIYI